MHRIVSHEIAEKPIYTHISPTMMYLAMDDIQRRNKLRAGAGWWTLYRKHKNKFLHGATEEITV